MTTVSVIIPLHDHAATIVATVHSVLTQTAVADGVRLEVVVVDDASTDGGADLLTGLPVTVIPCAAHGGAAAARNLGFSHCTGEFVMFLDSDDLATPERVRRQLAVLHGRPEVGVVGGNYDEFADPGYTPRRRPLHNQPTAMLGALLLRREAFEQVGDFDEQMGRREVVEWGARLRRSSVVMAPFDEVVLLRRLHEQNHGNDGAHQAQLLAAVRSHLIARKDAGRAPDPS